MNKKSKRNVRILDDYVADAVRPWHRRRRGGTTARQLFSENHMNLNNNKNETQYIRTAMSVVSLGRPKIECPRSQRLYVGSDSRWPIYLIRLFIYLGFIKKKLAKSCFSTLSHSL